MEYFPHKGEVTIFQLECWLGKCMIDELADNPKIIVDPISFKAIFSIACRGAGGLMVFVSEETIMTPFGPLKFEIKKAAKTINIWSDKSFHLGQCDPIQLILP